MTSNENDGIVHYLATKYLSYSFSHQELYNVGLFAMIQAEKTYNANKGCKLSTYIYNQVKFALLAYIKKNKPKQSTGYEGIENISQKVDKEFVPKLDLSGVVQYLDDIEFLTVREKDIICMRLNGSKIKDIAVKLKLSNSRVSVIEKKAMIKLVKYVARRSKNDSRME